MLKHLEHQLKQWQELAERYPQSAMYKENVVRLQQQRAELVNKIGR